MIREFSIDKYYQFIQNYPFKWRYFAGPYDSLEEARKAMNSRSTVSKRIIMTGAEFIKLRREYDERNSNSTNLK